MYGRNPYSSWPYDRLIITAAGGGGGTSYTLSLAQGSYSLTGESVTLNRGIKVSAAEGTYALTGQSSTLKVGMPAVQGSYTLTGQAVTFTKVSGGNLAANQGSYSLTGNAATLTKSLKVSAAQGSYSLTGQAATPKVGMPVVQGSYSLTGNAATLTKTGATLYSLSVTTGQYTLRRFDVNIDGLPEGGGAMHDPYGWGRHDRVKEIYKPNPMQKVRYHNPPDIQKAAAHMSSLGGHARAQALTQKQRTQIATNAAKARWK